MRTSYKGIIFCLQVLEDLDTMVEKIRRWLKLMRDVVSQGSSDDSVAPTDFQRILRCKHCFWSLLFLRFRHFACYNISMLAHKSWGLHGA